MSPLRPSGKRLEHNRQFKMKLRAFPCIDCHTAKLAAQSARTLRDARLMNNLTFHSMCVKGHRTIIFLEIQRFELLFDLAVMAILDGYYREAITSFQVAIERFHEFALRIIIEANGVPTSSSSFEFTWKQVVNQTERQLGAFLLAYFQFFGDEPEYTHEQFARLRNKATHQGYIPTESEVTSFGSNTYTYFTNTMRKLIEKCPDAVRQVMQHDREIVYQDEKALGNRVALNVSSCLALSARSDDMSECTFEQFGKRSWEESVRFLCDNRWLVS
jgi:hypothetical protein